MTKKFDRDHYRSLMSYRTNRGFFKNKKQRESFFWNMVGDGAAFFIVFYFIGYAIGYVGGFYIIFWPIIKAILGIGE